MFLLEITRNIETKVLSGGKIKEIIRPGKAYIFIKNIDNKLSFYFYQTAPLSLALNWISKRIKKEYEKIFPTANFEFELNEDQINEYYEQTAEQINRIPEIINTNLYDQQQIEEFISSGKKYHLLDNDPAWKERLKPENLPVFKNINLRETLDRLHKEPVENKFKRQMIIIGSNVYIPKEKIIIEFPKKRIKTSFEKVGTLPEGRFLPSENIAGCRLIISNKTIKSIEILGINSQNIDSKKRNKNKIENGTIRAPLFFIHRLTSERSIDQLEKGFNRPESYNFDKH